MSGTSLRSVPGIIVTLAACAYCGGLVYYFVDVGGSFQGAKDIGLGPTVMGLGAVGLLFCVVLLFKVFRLMRTPGRPGASGPGTSGPSLPDEEGGVDADEVISRYMARHASEARPATVSGAPDRPSSTLPTGFGRRNR